MQEQRATERRNPRTADIDLASPREIVDIINREDQGVPGAVATQAAEIAHAMALAEAAFRSGGRLIYAGAGTSGRLGVLDASECPPTFGVEPEMVQGVIAGGPAALTRAQEGAEDSPEQGGRAMDALGVGTNDFVLGIATSGTTPYVHGVIRRARTLGAKTGIFACSPPPQSILAECDVAIVVLVGPEALTGSSRMKAGTATKLVLNTISTGAMIRVGKTYGNLMIDVRATNAKLVDRSERIVMEVCRCSRETARATLDAADGSVKTAVVMQLLDVSRDVAEHRLAEAGGVVRRVVPQAPPPVVDA